MDIKSDKRGNVSITCRCGKPITKTNTYGMFCEEECGLADAQKAYTEMEELMKGFLPEYLK